MFILDLERFINNVKRERKCILGGENISREQKLLANFFFFETLTVDLIKTLSLKE